MSIRETSLSATSQSGFIIAVGTFALVLVIAFYIRPSRHAGPGNQQIGNYPEIANPRSNQAKEGHAKVSSLVEQATGMGRDTNRITETSDSSEDTEDTINKALIHGSRATREQMLAALAPHLATNDPDRATRLVQEILTSPKTEHAASPFVKAMIAELLTQAPERALAWADTLPESMSNLARDTTIKSWITSDTFAAADWIANLEEENLRQAYTQEVALNLLNAPPRQMR